MTEDDQLVHNVRRTADEAERLLEELERSPNKQSRPQQNINDEQQAANKDQALGHQAAKSGGSFNQQALLILAVTIPLSLIALGLLIIVAMRATPKQSVTSQAQDPLPKKESPEQAATDLKPPSTNLAFAQPNPIQLDNYTPCSFNYQVINCKLNRVPGGIRITWVDKKKMTYYGALTNNSYLRDSLGGEWRYLDFDAGKSLSLSNPNNGNVIIWNGTYQEYGQYVGL